jgi:hypothetical protein
MIGLSEFGSFIDVLARRFQQDADSVSSLLRSYLPDEHLVSRFKVFLSYEIGAERSCHYDDSGHDWSSSSEFPVWATSTVSHRLEAESGNDWNSNHGGARGF